MDTYILDRKDLVMDTYIPNLWAAETGRRPTWGQPEL